MHIEVSVELKRKIGTLDLFAYIKKRQSYSALYRIK